MIISVAVLRLVVPADWLVPALAGSVSLGMVGRGGGVALLRRSGMLRWADETDVGQTGCCCAGRRSVGGRFAAVADVGILAAVLGVVAALHCVSLVFAGTLRLLAPALLAQLWALRRRTPSAEVGSS